MISQLLANVDLSKLIEKQPDRHDHPEDTQTNQQASPGARHLALTLKYQESNAYPGRDREESQKLRPKICNPRVTLAHLLVLGEQDLLLRREVRRRGALGVHEVDAYRPALLTTRWRSADR